MPESDTMVSFRVFLCEADFTGDSPYSYGPLQLPFQYLLYLVAGNMYKKNVL